MKYLLRHLKPFIKYIILIFICVMLQAIADLFLPNLMSNIVDKGIVSEDFSYILKTGGVMLIITLFGGIASILLNYFSSKTGAGLAKNMRHEIFEKVESFSLSEFQKIGTNSLITRTTNDINQVQMVTILFLRLAFMAPFMGIGSFILAINKSKDMSFIILSGVIVILVLVLTIFKIVSKKFDLLQKLIDKTNLIARENLKGVRVIRAFRKEKEQHKKFTDTAIELEDVNLFINRMGALLNPMMNLVLNIVTIIILWVGSSLVDKNLLGIGDMMAFMQYAMLIMTSFLMLSVLFILIPRALISLSRIKEVIDSTDTIKEPKVGKKGIKDLSGQLEFKNVSFHYPGGLDPVLKDISFKVEKGQTLAIVGSTGSGKSTLINLILRFFDVSEGSILVDGVNVKDYKLKTLREKIGYVPQKSILLQGTIKENIMYKSPNDFNNMEKLKRATDIAQATSFILAKKDGFDSYVSQGGTNFSGGQRQRLSIARAIYSNPEFLIFDDSFSALDLKTDKLLRSEIKKHLTDQTKIIVTQRISTIKDADLIVVLDNGEQVGIGNHKFLLKNCLVYQEIAKSQEKGDEPYEK